MLLRDAMEPLARRFAHTLVNTGRPPGSAWRGYNADDAAKADLIPLKQWGDDAVGYVWHANHEARIILADIAFEDLDPNDFNMSERIVLDSKLRASDTVPFVNGSTEVQTAELEHWEETGENEIVANLAGFEKKTTVSAEVSGGVEGIAKAKASVVDETTVRASFERTTGRKTAKRAGGRFIFRQPPMTEGEARLTWSEQKMQTRVKRTTPDQVQGDHRAVSSLPQVQLPQGAQRVAGELDDRLAYCLRERSRLWPTFWTRRAAYIRPTSSFTPTARAQVRHGRRKFAGCSSRMLTS